MAPAMDLAHLAWPFFEPAHSDHAAAFRRWAAAQLATFEPDEGNDGKAARAIFELLAAADWLRDTLPARASGPAGIDLRRVCLLREICGYSSAIADVALSEPWLGILPIALFGSAALQEKYLPQYLSGRLLPAFALSEPGAGSDVAAITTTARREGDHYIINGRKTWTSNAGLADLYVVFVRIEDRGGADDIAAFVVDGKTTGLVWDERVAVSSPHTVGTWRLNDCRVPADHLIGAPGQGFKIAMAVLELYRPTVGAACLGFARRALAEAIARSTGRTTFNKPISEHQLIQAKLADMALGVDASALLVYRAAWQYDDGDTMLGREAAMAKLHATETAFAVIDQALQIFGGLGVVKGSVVERLFRHARVYRIFDGTSEIQRLIIAKSLLKERV
jgi:acyl-CoA dehydrogenase